VSGLYACLIARGDTPVQASPVPRGLSTRRQGGSRKSRTVPLVRVPRTLPRVLSPEEAGRLVAALRTHRDKAMVLAGLRRCEVLGLRMADVRAGDRRLFVAEGKGGHQRLIPVADRFLEALGDYLHDEPPATATDRVFVVLKGPRRGLPLSAEGLGPRSTVCWSSLESLAGPIWVGRRWLSRSWSPVRALGRVSLDSRGADQASPQPDSVALTRAPLLRGPKPRTRR
jgi:hypothetical protein